MEYDLEDRLIDFVIRISDVVEALPNTKLGNQIGNQFIRSGSAPALNYGEAQSAESTKDFIHKLKIIAKELRESLICLKIIVKKPLITPTSKLDPIIQENNELIAIIVSSIKTARKNSAEVK